MKQSSQKGFTLIELLIVIIILGVLASLIAGNFFTSLKKGRDARRKTDLQMIQRGLELYYEDNRTYPSSLVLNGTGQLCHPTGTCSLKVYINKIPADPNSSCTYSYVQDSGGTGYALYSIIENDNDSGPGVDQDGYASGNCTCGECKFAVSSPNVTP